MTTKTKRPTTRQLSDLLTRLTAELIIAINDTHGTPDDHDPAAANPLIIEARATLALMRSPYARTPRRPLMQHYTGIYRTDYGNTAIVDTHVSRRLALDLDMNELVPLTIIDLADRIRDCTPTDDGDVLEERIDALTRDY